MLEINKEERYDAEGFAWVASVPVRIPWYQCTLACTVIRDQAMSELDNIFYKCIFAQIQSAEDIAFVLALDLRIVQGQLRDLEKDGILECTGGLYHLTESGAAGFARHSRAQKCTEEYDVYLNGVTGQWSAERPAEPVHPAGKVLTIQPLLVAEWTENEDTEQLCATLGQRSGGHILAARFQSAQAMAYQEELMLVYQKEKEIRLAFLDEARDNWDIDTGSALGRQFKRRELLELLQVEAMVQAQSAENRFSGIPCDSSQLHFCRNREIREMFKNCFAEAKESIFIVSPWIDHEKYVVTDELLAGMRQAMERGVRLSIGCGYLPGQRYEELKKRMENSDEQVRQKNREWQTAQMALSLRKQFSGLPFEIFHAGTHEKILIIDDRYGYVGSFNLLSYDGGEQYEFEDFLSRREGGLMFESSEVAEQIKQDFQGMHGADSL